ncbi:Sec23-binding domain of Sec16-domain-containing protein [Infundibulicybe gibba]|nr:Sec23-binding domain of Sec16-domain-containing protein [Infundibulicybe gibba]
MHQPLQETQELQVKSAPAPYAPSPSLLGLNDPLGRTAARIPVFSFGFGGKVVTCFHGVANLQTGFDVALSSRNSTGINIHILNKIVPQSALDASMAEYPGPLFMDPGTPTTNLVRTGVSTQLKAKKGRVQKYLTDRMDEISQGLGYLNKNSPDKYRAESRLVLLRLLHAMVEHDGRVSGTTQIDKAMRSALVPGPNDETVESSISTSTTGFSAPADVQSLAAGLPLTQFSSPLADPQDHVISTTTLHSSSLDKIQDFLIRGERRLAYHYALDNQLWPHAMVIASSIDKDAWKEVVGEFLKSELGVKSHTLPTNYHHATTLPPTNGREGLRVAYSLYSGQGSAAVQELVPQNLLARATNRPQLPVVSHASSTPLTPNFGAPLPVPIPAESLSKWAETAAMMLSSPMTAETSSAFTALGDQLVASKCFEAAHVCYLLAPQTSPIGGPGNPTARIMLLGSQNPHLGASLGKDPDPIIFSEILEFALSLTPTAKGQDGFGGLAHLQSYRFVRAMSYAELGDLQLASSYCEAITASLGRGSPYFTNTLVEQLKGLSDRIAGVSHNDKSGSWMGAKLSKPSLDTIGGWLEGRFTKLVTGETDTAALPQEETNHVTDQSFSGPFTHYSTISSTTPSASPSPQPSVINLNTLPPRSGSALATSSPYVPHTQIDRASSAMDYTRRKPSPGPRVASASAATTTFSHTPSFGQALNAFSSNGRYSPSQETPKPRSHDANGSEGAAPGQEVSWWGASSYGETDDQTPRTATFLPIEEGSVSATSDGFISLMDTPSVSTTPQSSIRNFQTSTIPEDEEDLGFGNSRLTPNREHNNQSNESSPVNVEPTPTKANSEPSSESTFINVADNSLVILDPPKQPPASTGSWISRWWKRPESATPGPIKASLGEEKAFYYDEKLKKWVNPKDTAGPPTPSVPPPPPSRAQTASPAMTGHRPPSAAGSAAPPPARASSAIDLTSSPPNKSTMRVRSNLVPPPESAPSTPTGSRLAPQGPPPGRPKSQASKRNIRNRYVDVFQEGGGP